MKTTSEKLNQRISALSTTTEDIISKIKNFKIETPSWGYSDSGTRFNVYKQASAAKTVWDKIDDAAIVNTFTGVCDSVALHIPWDKTDDYAKLIEYATQKGVKLGAVNPNLFQDDEYKLGSLSTTNETNRKKAITHMKECVDIATIIGSQDISLWLADGTNYAGQDSIIARKHALEDSLQQVYDYMPENQRILIEYKGFEPSFYHTDLADWGMSANYARKLGDRAKVLVDLGHHPQGVNIEHIVAFLLDEGIMGGFHFNGRKYADDDLIVGSVNPFELFLIFHEIISSANIQCTDEIAYMIDQSHNVEEKIPAMIISVENIQQAYVKALMVDRSELVKKQKSEDVMEAYKLIVDAFNTDVSPLLELAREEMNAPVNPFDAYLKSDYRKKIANR